MVKPNLKIGLKLKVFCWIQEIKERSKLWWGFISSNGHPKILVVISELRVDSLVDFHNEKSEILMFSLRFFPQSIVAIHASQTSET